MYKSKIKILQNLQTMKLKTLKKNQSRMKKNKRKLLLLEKQLPIQFGQNKYKKLIDQRFAIYNRILTYVTKNKVVANNVVYVKGHIYKSIIKTETTERIWSDYIGKNVVLIQNGHKQGHYFSPCISKTTKTMPVTYGFFI